MTDVIVSNKDVVVEVAQPTVPAAAVPPKIGLVEINQVVQRGSAWMTGNGPPTLAGGQYGDMYLDVDTGDMYLWDGAEWQYQGTFAPSTLTPEEILAAMLTVDGDGSMLDADLLDGQHGVYYAKQSDMDAQTAKNTAQDGTLATHTTQIANNTANISSIGGATSTNSADIDALEAGLATEASTRAANDTTLQGNITAEATARATADSTEATTRANADTALDAKITTEKNRNDTQDTTIATKIGDAPNDGGQYVRKNAAWALVSVPPGTIVSDTAPASPAPNQMWMKSTTGVLYIFYADPDGSQWIQLSASPQIVDQNYTRKTARAKNLLVNPSMQVSQENGQASVTAIGAFPADQWALIYSGLSMGAQNTQSLLSPNNSKGAVGFWATAVKASLAASDNAYVYQAIEGLRVAELGWGTAQAIPAVVRICAYCEQAGTYSFALLNNAQTHCFVKAMALTTGWNTFSFTIPAQTGGVWPVDNTKSMQLCITGACGTTNTAPAEGWNTGGVYIAAPGQSNLAAQTGKSLIFTDVGLYPDPDKTGIAPSFEPSSYEDDLARCQRYWRGGNFSVSGYVAASSNNIADLLAYPVTMRVVPTTSNTITGKATIIDFIMGSSIDALTVNLNTNGTGTGNAFCYGTYKSSARM